MIQVFVLPLPVLPHSRCYYYCYSINTRYSSPLFIIVSYYYIILKQQQGLAWMAHALLSKIRSKTNLAFKRHNICVSLLASKRNRHTFGYASCIVIWSIFLSTLRMECFAMGDLCRKPKENTTKNNIISQIAANSCVKQCLN